MTAIYRPFRLSALGFLAAAGLIALNGCGPTTGMMSSSLEDDELYLSPGESFTTDAEYLAFAMVQAGLNVDGTPSGRSAESGDDYYDPDRANRSMNDARYSPNFGLGGSGYGFNNFGGGWGMMPSAYFGVGSPGMNSWNNPWNSPWNSPWNNGWGGSPYGGYGYSPWMNSGWGPTYGYGYGGYPYGYNNWNNGGWWGSSAWNDTQGTGNGIISGLRVPLATNTGNNSSYNDGGLYAQPRSLADPGKPHPGEVRPGELLTPESDLSSPSNPTGTQRTSPQGSRIQRLLETPSVPAEIREPNAPDNRFNVDPNRYNPPAASPSRSNSNSSRPSNSPSYSPSRPSNTPSTSPSRSSSGGSSPSRSSNSSRRP